jgi:MinD-like ATPase involved in chromosome partitioning or flagellar assembly
MKPGSHWIRALVVVALLLPALANFRLAQAAPPAHDEAEHIANAESVLGRPIDHKVINEYRGAIGALNSGAPFMISRPGSPLAKAVSDFAATVDKNLSVVEVEA